jgi:hypothetical protein
MKEVKSVSISVSDRDKKYKAVFKDKDGHKVKTTHFGAKGMSDYTKHKDKERKKRYLKRHNPKVTKEDWTKPTTPGALSRYILWNKPSLSGSIKDFKRQFNLK